LLAIITIFPVDLRTL